jgi:hypothetical protein
MYAEVLAVHASEVPHHVPPKETKVPEGLQILSLTVSAPMSIQASNSFVYVAMHTEDDLGSGVESFGIFGVYTSLALANEVKQSLAPSDVQIVKVRLNDVHQPYISAGGRNNSYNSVRSSTFPKAASNRVANRRVATLQSLNGMPANLQRRMAGNLFH